MVIGNQSFRSAGYVSVLQHLVCRMLGHGYRNSFDRAWCLFVVYAPRIVFWKHKAFQLRFSALLVATYMLDVQPALQ